MRQVFALVAIIGLIPLTPALADPTVTKVSTNKKEVQVAEPFEIRFEVETNNSTKIAFPPIGSSLGELNVVSLKQFDDLPSPSDPVNKRQWSLLVTAESLLPGPYEIPSIEIQCTRGGKTETLRTETKIINVATLVSEDASLEEIRAPKGTIDAESVEESPSIPWPWMAGAAIMLVAAMCLGTWWLNRKESPEQWANRALDQIDSTQNDRQQGEVVILRSYLEMVSGVNATRLTRQETISELSQSGSFPKDLLRAIEERLRADEEARYRASETKIAFEPSMGARELIERIGVYFRQIATDRPTNSETGTNNTTGIDA